MGVNLHALAFGNEFSGSPPTAGAAQEKTDKLDFIKIKNGHASKEEIQMSNKHVTSVWPPVAQENHGETPLRTWLQFNIKI